MIYSLLPEKKKNIKALSDVKDRSLGVRCRLFSRTLFARYINHRLNDVIDYATTSGLQGNRRFAFTSCFFPFPGGGISGEFRNGRPSTAVKNKNIDAVHRGTETDRHVTYYEYLDILRHRHESNMISPV
ncbi:hypothetical protein EVAR_46920_1 [Eumeta japonica]|uniref:Uncharacterized protein n=1 Tax=Eumeta variegata TaxID=151549 RepID=A0A4C1XZC9_EUMVA|nr:hypothetical protein EVAR_46920_1 [Eumeta japonica]